MGALGREPGLTGREPGLWDVSKGRMPRLMGGLDTKHVENEVKRINQRTGGTGHTEREKVGRGASCEALVPQAPGLVP